MKIRRAYAIKPLKTKTVKLKLLGGDGGYTAHCVGYRAGADCIAPSRGFAEYNGQAVIKNLESVSYYENIGSGLALASTGQIYRWTDTPSGAPFSYAGLVGTYYHSAFECFYDGAPAVAVVSGTRITFVTAEKYYNKQLPYNLKGACLHMGRVFATDIFENYSIRWSGTDILDWAQSADGSGYIKLNPERGKIYRTLSFGNDLVVFREFGFDVIKAFGDPRHFAVVHQGCKNVTERLREDTCVVCGDKIYCCSESAIYCFDGEKTEAVKLPDYMRAKDFCAGKSHGGRYVFYYCTAVFSGEEYQLEMDVQNGTFAFFASGKKFLWGKDGLLRAWKDDTVYIESYDACNAVCVWRSKAIDLGKAGVKTLKKIYVDKTDGAEVTVNADGVSRSFVGNGEITVAMSGRNFTFEVVGGGRVNTLEAEWEVRV